MLWHDYFIGVLETVLKSALHLAPVQTLIASDYLCSIFTLYSSTKYYEKNKINKYLQGYSHIVITFGKVSGFLAQVMQLQLELTC